MDLIKQIIPIDFNVECTYEDDERTIFMASRNSLLHIVAYTLDTRSITQYHLPYFSLVDPLSHIKTKRSAGKVVASLDNEKTSWDIHSDVRLIVLGGEIKMTIGGATIKLSELCVRRKLSRLVGKLRRARLYVIQSESGYTLPFGQTPSSLPVASPSRCLVEGISFEAATNRRLLAEEFGLFSAYCTHNDITRETKESYILEDAKLGGMTTFSGVSSARMTDTLETLQSRYFSEPIWKPGSKVDDGTFVNALRTALRRLDDTQITQMVLMIGMHSALIEVHGFHVLFAFATVAAIMTFDEYKDFICEGLQPDSEAEQSIRASASYIELFGKLAAASNPRDQAGSDCRSVRHAWGQGNRHEKA